MTKTILVLFISILTITSGCGVKSDDKKAETKEIVSEGVVVVLNDGRCSQEMIDAHNAVDSRKNLTENKSTCQRFKSLIASNSCVASPVSSTERITIDSKSRDFDCVVAETKCSEETALGIIAHYTASKEFNKTKSTGDHKKFVKACVDLKTSLATTTCSLGDSLNVSFEKRYSSCNSVIETWNKAYPNEKL